MLFDAAYPLKLKQRYYASTQLFAFIILLFITIIITIIFSSLNHFLPYFEELDLKFSIKFASVFSTFDLKFPCLIQKPYHRGTSCPCTSSLKSWYLRNWSRNFSPFMDQILFFIMLKQEILRSFLAGQTILLVSIGFPIVGNFKIFWNKSNKTKLHSRTN